MYALIPPRKYWYDTKTKYYANIVESIF